MRSKRKKNVIYTERAWKGDFYEILCLTDYDRIYLTMTPKLELEKRLMYLFICK